MAVRTWTGWTALGWTLGVALPVLVLTALPVGVPIWGRAVTAVLAAVAMGLVVGLVTAWPLARIMGRLPRQP